MYCRFSGLRCLVLSLLYYSYVDIEEVGGMSDHGAVNVVVLFLMFGKKLLWGGGRGLKKGFCICVVGSGM